MNPVLLKPERDTASQVVVMGQVRPDLAAVPWRERSETLWPFAREALDALLAENDVVVIEGDRAVATCHTMVNMHGEDGFFIGRLSASRIDLARQDDLSATADVFRFFAGAVRCQQGQLSSGRRFCRPKSESGTGAANA